MNPFKFLSYFINLNESINNEAFSNIPISMDASSSAYQILSYFTFNEQLAIGTNLIKDPVNKPYEYHDLYNTLLEDIKEKNLEGLLDNDHKLADAVRKRLSRKLMKKIYMPLVYGQTKHSATTDIISNLGENLDGKDAYKLAEGL